MADAKHSAANVLQVMLAIKREIQFFPAFSRADIKRNVREFKRMHRLYERLLSGKVLGKKSRSPLL